MTTTDPVLSIRARIDAANVALDNAIFVGASALAATLGSEIGALEELMTRTPATTPAGVEALLLEAANLFDDAGTPFGCEVAVRDIADRVVTGAAKAADIRQLREIKRDALQWRETTWQIPQLIDRALTFLARPRIVVG